MTEEILFLAHRTPFPPDRGDKIRSHHVLKALAQIAPVHVGCLAETEADLKEGPQLASLASSFAMPLRRQSLPVAGVAAVVKGHPISLTAFADRKLTTWVRKVLDERPIGAIYVFSGQMGQYVPADWQGRLVVDFVDVDSAKFDAYAKDGSGPMALVHGREGRLLSRYENQLSQRADLSLFISEEEVALMQQRCPQAGLLRALRNGVDCDQYDPQLFFPHPELAAFKGPHFVFSGQMDYAPNIDAVTRFARQILPQIRQHHDRAQFHIVGRAPSPAVEKLVAEPGTNVWGEVPDMRPFLAAADMVVAPLTIARGVQNKVLEAMAMGRPVLASPEALIGIDGRAGEHFMACADDEAFIQTALALVENLDARIQMGAAARSLVKDRMSWPAMLAQLPQIMGLAGSDSDKGCLDAA